MFIVHEMLQDGELSTIDTVAIPSVPPTPSVEWVNPTRTVSSIQPIPFVHRSRWIVGPDGNFWVTEGDGSYSIRRVSAHGDLLGAFQREYTPVPIPSRIRRDSIESFRQEGRIALDGVDEDRVPEVYPPFDNYFVGTDGVLWVRRSAENGAAALDLFGSDGEYRGEVAVPRDFERIRVEHATAEALFGVFHDDLGVSYAVRLRIVPPH
jgi:hypothetical protein